MQIQKRDKACISMKLLLFRILLNLINKHTNLMANYMISQGVLTLKSTFKILIKHLRIIRNTVYLYCNISNKTNYCFSITTKAN